MTNFEVVESMPEPRHGKWNAAIAALNAGQQIRVSNQEYSRGGITSVARNRGIKVRVIEADGFFYIKKTGER